MKFQREKAVEVKEEITSLIQAHHDEISEYKELTLDPNFEEYLGLDRAEYLRLFTARDQDHRLCGYQVFFIIESRHYRRAKYAHQDLLYIIPEKRGHGMSFIRWCDEQLKAEGIDVVYQTVTTRCDYSLVLRRLGYQLSEYIYSRRLQ